MYFDEELEALIKESDALTREEAEEAAERLGWTLEQYAQDVFFRCRVCERYSEHSLRVVAAEIRALVRLGLIPEPPLWPGFSPTGDGAHVTTEAGVTVRMFLDDNGDFHATLPGTGKGGTAVTPRGALESLCAGFDPGTPSRAAVAAILSRK